MVHYVEGFASEGLYQFLLLNSYTGLAVSFQSPFQLLAENFHI
jgi:hypothetical protein